MNMQSPIAAARTDANHVEALIIALERVRADAMAGKLWDAPRAVAVLNAIYDLTGCQAIYDDARSIGVTFGIDPDGDPINFMGARA